MTNEEMTNEEAIGAIKAHCYFNNLVPVARKALDKAIKSLEQETQTWSLDDARDDFISDVYDTLDFLPTNNEANRIIDIFDRVTSGIKQEPVLDKVSSEISKTWYTQPKNRYEEGLKDQALKDMKIIDKYRTESDVEKRKEWSHKPCINYEDGCEEWAGCPCVYYKAKKESD